MNGPTLNKEISVVLRCPPGGFSNLNFIRHVKKIIGWCHQNNVEFRYLGSWAVEENAEGYYGWDIFDEQDRFMFILKWSQ